MKELELYLHIPFCARKCLYCDFLSAPADKSTQDAYMKALIKEVEGRAKDYQNDMIISVFIGGGTPSAVEPIWIARLMQAVRRHYHLVRDAEITMEMNPGTVNAEGLKVYKQAGINRVSIGLQSADNGELKMLGRIHNWEEFEENYYLIRELGFDNVNVDLMSGLPGQTVDGFLDTLEKVTKLSPEPEHISAYSLIVEEGTSFFSMVEDGMLCLPTEEEDRAIYEMTKEYLRGKGYSRYEISNYAKEGYACKHNMGYWKRVPYLGMGIGAASLIKRETGEFRFRNGDELEKYIADPMNCVTDLESLDVQAVMEEFCFLRLRMTEGISLNEFTQEFGVSIEEVYRAVLDKNLQDGLLEYVELNDGDKAFTLTEEGMNLANYVMAQFLQD